MVFLFLNGNVGNRFLEPTAHEIGNEFSVFFIIRLYRGEINKFFVIIFIGDEG